MRKLSTMAKVVIIFYIVFGLFGGLSFMNSNVAPFFFYSRLDRLREANLPRIIIEKGGVVYCRMKADDFRFPLPKGARATNLVVTGGYDTVDGSVEARFESTNKVTAGYYQMGLLGKIQIGGQVTAQDIAGGMLIKFHYFGDF